MLLLPGLSQLRITLRLPAAPLSLLGAAGGGVANTMTDAEPFRFPITARTWKLYSVLGVRPVTV